MAENTGISWTHHTFNPWRGCTKVSAGCKNCYADALSGRNPKTLGVWGPKGTRPIAAEAYWRLPLRWDREAQTAGERRRVFCASLADVFERADTMPESEVYGVEKARYRLFDDVIRATPNLDWLLLTKRPDHAAWWLEHYSRDILEGAPLPSNVWVGTSVEDQAAADERIPHLLRIPAAVRFLSCEPLLGPVDLHRWLLGFDGGNPASCECGHGHGFTRCPNYGRVSKTCHVEGCTCSGFSKRRRADGIHWVITGGESGPKARPMHPDWARSLRDQCAAAGVPFHFKQWGEWVTAANEAFGRFPGRVGAIRPDGKLSEDLPQEEDAEVLTVKRVGVRNAGRDIFGRTHDAFPEVARGA